MIARGTTITVAAPSPWTKRAATSAAIVGRERAGERADKEDRDADVERRLAAQPVRERPVDELRDAEGSEKGGQRELRRLRRGAELGRDQRQRRQVHVDREGPERAEQADDERDAYHSGFRGHGIPMYCCWNTPAKGKRPDALGI